MTTPDKPKSSKQQYHIPGTSYLTWPGVAYGAPATTTGQVKRLLRVFEKEHSRVELQTRLGLKHRDTSTEVYLKPALKAGLVEMTSPDKPKSSQQEYRLTEKGRKVRNRINLFAVRSLEILKPILESR